MKTTNRKSRIVEPAWIPGRQLGVLPDLLRACQDFRESGDEDAHEAALQELDYQLGIVREPDGLPELPGEPELDLLCDGMSITNYADKVGAWYDGE